MLEVSLIGFAHCTHIKLSVGTHIYLALTNWRPGLKCRDNPSEGWEVVRRSQRLNPSWRSKVATPSRPARKTHRGSLSKESEEGDRSTKSTSEEWHSEESSSDTETDLENEVSVGVVKPHRDQERPQVSAQGYPGSDINKQHLQGSIELVLRSLQQMLSII